MAKRKGKATFIKTEKGLIPVSKLRAAEQPKSKQIKKTEGWMLQHGLIQPPYAPDTFLTLHEHSPAFWACVNQIAVDVAGLGWNVQLREGQKEDKSEYNKIQDFLRTANPDTSLRTVFKELLIDWGSIGYFGIEVIRNGKGEVAQLHRVPAHTLRIHEDKEKFCQVRNEKKVWFKKFGLDEDISSKTGEPTRVGPKTRASELIYYRNTYQKSDYYGVPNILPAVGDVIGLIGCRDYNISFFSNYGVPSAIIILSGEWDDGAEAEIEAFVSAEVKGSENAHRTLVLSEPDECTIEYKPLDLDVKEGSFSMYEQSSKENVLIAYSMPPERVGIRVTGELGGNVAEEAMKVYKAGVVEPLQTDLEDIINNLILIQGLECEKYEFKFTDIDVRDLDLLVDRLTKQIDYAMMTPNEARNILGRKPYEGGDKFYVDPNWIEAGHSEEESISKLVNEFEKEGSK